VGAYDLYPGASIVVDLGTATVFDVISAKGEYLGGAIARAWPSHRRALLERGGAALSRAGSAPFGHRRSMVESIQSGVLYGFAAQVDGMIERILEELGEATVIATAPGGLIAPHTKHVQHVERG